MPNNNFSEPNIVTMLELFIYLLCLVHNGIHAINSHQTWIFVLNEYHPYSGM
jgi:hypothetical protein